MNIKDIIEDKIAEVIQSVFQIDDVNHPNSINLEVQQNKSEFEGDFTIVTFPLVKVLKKSPDLIAMELGDALSTQSDFVESYNVVKGFLNLTIKKSFFLENFKSTKENFDRVDPKNETVMVEYSSPNTNKPLHLGHIRNNLLGYSVAKILTADGYSVIKTQIINDRGIHICKSMLAWERYGNGETPQSTGIKGDKFVGNYYVEFDKHYKKEIAELKEQGYDEDVAKKQAPIILEAQKMLLDWEKGDEKVRARWKEMNRWVYEGFGETYRRLGVDFDQVQYESNTYTYDAYGNVTYQAKSNNSSYITYTTVYGTFGTPVPAKPTSITINTTRTGEPAFSTQTTFGYNAIGQCTLKTVNPSTSESVQTAYTYYPLGNINTETITPNSMSPIVTTYTYDAKGRFTTSIKNPLKTTETSFFFGF